MEAYLQYSDDRMRFENVMFFYLPLELAMENAEQDEPGFCRYMRKMKMRNPERILAILDALQEVWEKHPDWRFGQLLINVANRPEPCPRLFNLEDDLLLELLQEMSKSHGSKSNF